MSSILAIWWCRTKRSCCLLRLVIFVFLTSELITAHHALADVSDLQQVICNEKCTPYDFSLVLDDNMPYIRVKNGKGYNCLDIITYQKRFNYYEILFRKGCLNDFSDDDFKTALNIRKDKKTVCKLTELRERWGGECFA